MSGMESNERPPFVHRRRVEFGDTDMAGITHFASYFRFLEEAEHAYLRAVGLSVFTRTGADVLTWPRLSARCDFHRPSRFEDVLDVEVRVKELSRKTVTYRFDVRHGEHPVATGETVVVCCQIDSAHELKSTPIPDDVRRRLTLGPPSEEPAPSDE